MIRLENTEVVGWEHAIRGMRNPMNSWEKSDSDYRPILCSRCDSCGTFKLETWEDCDECEVTKYLDNSPNGFLVGPNDHDLMMRLRNAGTDHRKFMRMIVVYVDITAPLYWWSEYDTYKVGTVANSCSKMHKLLYKPFEMNDFSFDHLPGYKFEVIARPIVDTLNKLRDSWLTCEDESSKKTIWYSVLQLLPSSYNQKRTVMLNYEVLANIYKSRKNHKLDEWIEFCKWIESLPYSELITGGVKTDE